MNTLDYIQFTETIMDGEYHKTCRQGKLIQPIKQLIEHDKNHFVAYLVNGEQYFDIFHVATVYDVEDSVIEYSFQDGDKCRNLIRMPGLYRLVTKNMPETDIYEYSNEEHCEFLERLKRHGKETLQHFTQKNILYIFLMELNRRHQHIIIKAGFTESLTGRLGTIKNEYGCTPTFLMAKEVSGKRDEANFHAILKHNFPDLVERCVIGGRNKTELYKLSPRIIECFENYMVKHNVKKDVIRINIVPKTYNTKQFLKDTYNTGIINDTVVAQLFYYMFPNNFICKPGVRNVWHSRVADGEFEIMDNMFITYGQLVNDVVIKYVEKDVDDYTKELYTRPRNIRVSDKELLWAEIINKVSKNLVKRLGVICNRTNIIKQLVPKYSLNKTDTETDIKYEVVETKTNVDDSDDSDTESRTKSNVVKSNTKTCAKPYTKTNVVNSDMDDTEVESDSDIDDIEVESDIEESEVESDEDESDSSEEPPPVVLSKKKQIKLPSPEMPKKKLSQLPIKSKKSNILNC